MDFEIYYFLEEENVPKSQNIVSYSKEVDSLVSFSQNNTQSNDSVKIPVYDEVYVSAGQGFINDEHITRHIELDRGFLRSYFGLLHSYIYPYNSHSGFYVIPYRLNVSF